jgi:hypothetical protein
MPNDRNLNATSHLPFLVAAHFMRGLALGRVRIEADGLDYCDLWRDVFRETA